MGKAQWKRCEQTAVKDTEARACLSTAAEVIFDSRSKQKMLSLANQFTSIVLLGDNGQTTEMYRLMSLKLLDGPL